MLRWSLLTRALLGLSHLLFSSVCRSHVTAVFAGAAVADAGVAVRLLMLLFVGAHWCCLSAWAGCCCWRSLLRRLARLLVALAELLDAGCFRLELLAAVSRRRKRDKQRREWEEKRGREAAAAAGREIKEERGAEAVEESIGRE
ncbi:hypothetical protein KY284_024537 [Solanum tuberosum]|nr:hypothetical protein KY284_024537 [Solanum tuberosum]